MDKYSCENGQSTSHRITLTSLCSIKLRITLSKPNQIPPNKTKINLNTVKSGVINILKTTKKEMNNDIKRK